MKRERKEEKEKGCWIVVNEANVMGMAMEEGDCHVYKKRKVMAMEEENTKQKTKEWKEKENVVVLMVIMTAKAKVK